MRSKLFKYIKWFCGTPIYISVNRLINLIFTLNYVIIDGCKRPIRISIKFIRADKAQTLYLFRQLDINLAKSTGFKLIYCLIIPQAVFYNPLI